MRLTKAKAFIICFIAIMSIFFCMFIFTAIKNKDIEAIPVKECLTAIVAVTTAFMGIQMANNGVKGHNWSQEMYDSENNRRAKYDRAD